MMSLRRINVPGLATVVLLLVLWESLVAAEVVEYEYLPPPTDIAAGAQRLLSSGELLDNLFHTLTVTLLGWLSAAAVGILIGMLLGLSSTAWRYSMASVEMMRAIPPISLVPVALLVFGFSLRMELTIVIFVSVWPVLINTIDGVRSVPPGLRDVARMLRMSRLDLIRKITLPAALPSIMVGLRLALSLSLVLAVVSEMIGNPDGLGNALVLAQQALQPEEMFAYVLTIGLLGVGLNTAFRLASSQVPAASPGQQRNHRP